MSGSCFKQSGMGLMAPCLQVPLTLFKKKKKGSKAAAPECLAEMALNTHYVIHTHRRCVRERSSTSQSVYVTDR